MSKIKINFNSLEEAKTSIELAKSSIENIASGVASAVNGIDYRLINSNTISNISSDLNTSLQRLTSIVLLYNEIIDKYNNDYIQYGDGMDLTFLGDVTMSDGEQFFSYKKYNLVYTASNNATIGYEYYIPKNVSENPPLITTLYGADQGYVGSGVNLKNNYFRELLMNNNVDSSAIVLLPFANAFLYSEDECIGGNSAYTQAYIELVNKFGDKFNCSNKTLIAHSYGGNAAFDILNNYPGMYDAAIFFGVNVPKGFNLNEEHLNNMSEADREAFFTTQIFACSAGFDNDDISKWAILERKFNELRQKYGYGNKEGGIVAHVQYYTTDGSKAQHSSQIEPWLSKSGANLFLNMFDADGNIVLLDYVKQVTQGTADIETLEVTETTPEFVNDTPGEEPQNENTSQNLPAEQPTTQNTSASPNPPSEQPTVQNTSASPNPPSEQPTVQNTSAIESIFPKNDYSDILPKLTVGTLGFSEISSNHVMYEIQNITDKNYNDYIESIINQGFTRAEDGISWLKDGYILKVIRNNNSSMNVLIYLLDGLMEV